MNQRLEDIRKYLPENADGALITTQVNRRYFSGFESSDGYVIITRNSAYLCVDARYIEAARRLKPEMEICLVCRGFLLDFCTKNKLKTLVCEGEISAARLNALNENDSVEFFISNKFDEAICSMRAVKTDDEIIKIKAAQNITDRAFSNILNILRPGISEAEIALEIDYYFRKNGACSAFETIAVSGLNSSMPHGVPSRKPICNGEFLTMDFGACFNGFCSDMTRTVAIGYVNDKMQSVYETVLLAQKNAISKIKAGVECAEADCFARGVIDRSGYGEYFTHSTGHGVGLEIHEAPSLSSASKKILQKGNVVTVEPGIYIQGEFGVRIEDFGLVCDDGFENFTASAKELIIIHNER